MRAQRSLVSKRKRKRLNGSHRPDHGTAERWQHGVCVLEPTERRGIRAAREIEENVLDALHIRGLIEGSEREAGLRLRNDYYAAGLENRVAAHYGSIRCPFNVFGSWDERTKREETAYRRWRIAVNALGMAYADIVISVACLGQHPTGQHITRLKEGLKFLVDWYKLAL